VIGNVMFCYKKKFEGEIVAGEVNPSVLSPPPLPYEQLKKITWLTDCSNSLAV